MVNVILDQRLGDRYRIPAALSPDNRDNAKPSQALYYLIQRLLLTLRLYVAPEFGGNVFRVGHGLSVAGQARGAASAGVGEFQATLVIQPSEPSCEEPANEGVACAYRVDNADRICRGLGDDGFSSRLRRLLAAMKHSP